MPRRSGVPKRQVLPDSKYNSVLVTKIINQVMLDGKKQAKEGRENIPSKRLKKVPYPIY